MELLIAFSVLLVNLGGFLHSLLASTKLRQSDEEIGRASRAARAIVETISAELAADAWALYNADPSDDPLGPGSAAGTGFAVLGLEPVIGDADGFVGEILFPESNAVPGTLTEIAAFTNFSGMPRDLNLDGDALDADVTADFKVLPAVVRVEWRGASGARQRVELSTIFADF